MITNFECLIQMNYDERKKKKHFSISYLPLTTHFRSSDGGQTRTKDDDNCDLHVYSF